MTAASARIPGTECSTDATAAPGCARCHPLARTLLPVLASDTGGMSDLLKPLGLEWLVAPGAAEAWAAARSRLGELGRVEAGGRQARAHYEKPFTEASAAAALDDAYQAAPDRVMGSGTA